MGEPPRRVPRQHPVLPLSSHVGAGTSLFPHCPASCVEEGRWHPSGAGFVPSLVLNVFHVFCGEIYSRSGVAGLPPHCSRELCEAKENSPGAAVRHSVLEAPAPAPASGAAFAWSLSSCVARRSCSQSSGIFYHRLTLTVMGVKHVNCISSLLRCTFLKPFNISEIEKHLTIVCTLWFDWQCVFFLSDI